MLERLVWAEINLRNFTYNFSAIKKLIGAKVDIMVVVKANAYGHGAIEVAKQADKLKPKYLGVVCFYEANQLRENGITSPILILNYIDPEGAKSAIERNITLNVMDEEVLKAIDKHARKKAIKAKIHVKIDSGMHRLGLLPDQALRFISKIEKYKNVKLEGIFTHFACADEKSLDFTRNQLAEFILFISKLKEKGINIPIIHAANSAATIRLPISRLDMVRPGIVLYGLFPSYEFKLPFKPKPVMSLKTKIVQLRLIKKGETVGYGRTFIARKKTLVASLPVGYADGFRRAPANWGFVLIKGLKAPILGRISMDQSSIDVTGIPAVKVGDEIILIGDQGNQTISAEDVAYRLGTINYEVTSCLANRVSRVYIH